MGIVTAEHLTRRYLKPGSRHETFAAVDGICLDIQAGEIYGILGPNGAGKTSALEMLEGIGDIDGGRASIDGVDVQTERYALKRLIGVQLQASEYFEHLSLVELLKLFAALYGRRVDPLALLAQVDLADKAQARPASLSGGQKQRFSIACALVNTPKVLFLDEPTTGLDPQAKRRLWELVRQLNAEGMTIVLTTHNMEEAETLCQRVAIMDQGRIIAEGSPADLIREYAPEPPDVRLQGDLEDVFLRLTGSALRE